MAMRWVLVARRGDIPLGQVRAAQIGGLRLALVNVRGTIYALDAACPHQGGPLDEGALWQETLECPWHHFRYDPATGANIYPANVYPQDMPQLDPEVRPVRVFPTKIRGDNVLLGLPDEG